MDIFLYKLGQLSKIIQWPTDPIKLVLALQTNTHGHVILDKNTKHRGNRWEGRVYRFD